MTIWNEDSPISRRQALERLGIAAGAGILASFGVSGPAVAAPFGPHGVSTPNRRAAPIIRAVLEDITPESLGSGPVLIHEHLSMHFPLGSTDHFTDDVALMTEEVRIAAREGIACIVDAGHPDMARNLEALKQIARDSGMPIVASGGFYMQRSYPPELTTKSAEEIANDLVAEAARDHLGAFGEIGQQEGVLTSVERKVFESIGIAAARTGIPVFTHNPYSGQRESDVPRDAGLRQLDILTAAGARPESIAIGHVCCLDDPNVEIASEIASRGAFVGFDRVTLNAIMPDEKRVAMTLALVEAGHADKLLLSSDFYSARSLKSRGGGGLGQTATVFGPMLLEAGLPESTLNQILVENPKRFLTFEPLA